MKKSLVFALALMLVLAFATSAFAAQARIVPSTTSGGAYPFTSDTAKTFQQTVKTLTVDGATYYPYEIYLPNEASPDAYRIHTSYAKNTDACASCHATHTAVGASLLQWYTVYETCMACHDGTISSTYDVAQGDFAGGMAAQGGAFGTGEEASSSNHNVTGAMSIAAAPGGSTAAVHTDSNGKALDWEIEFGCESCHTPHGLGGNARILHPDANQAATNRAKDSGYSVAGISAENVGGNVWIAGSDLTEATAADSAYNAYYFLNTYPYNTKTSVKVDGVEFSNGYVPNSKFSVSNAKGYSEVTFIDAALIAAATATPDKVTIVGIPTLKVTMDIDDYLKATETVEHVSGMNSFCGACHTDYNTASVAAATYNSVNGEFEGSGGKLTGAYSSAHRHQVGFQWHADEAGLKFERGQLGATGATQYGMECLTCHVAHGVNEDFWAASLEGAGQAWFGLGLNLKELAGSSALKRMPNMGTCETCHAKGDGNEGYLANVTGAAGVLGSTLGTTDGIVSNWYSYNAKNAFGLGAGIITAVYGPGGTDPSPDENAYTVTGLIYEPPSTSAAIRTGFRVLRAGALTFSTPATRNAFFTPSASGFFNPSIAYVGNAVCASCHGDYMKGYTESHGNSFATAAGADLTTKIADTYNKAHTLPVGTSFGTEDINGKVYEFYVKAQDQIAMKVPGGADVLTYTITSNGSGGYKYTTQNGLSYDLTASAGYLFMDHYVLGAKGATLTDLDGTGTAGTVTALAYQYLRFAQWEPDAKLVIPYLNRTTGVPDKASAVAWRGNSASATSADGCISCHTPQIEYGKGDVGITCETCHGPGAKHAAAPTTTNIFTAKATTDEHLETIDAYQQDRLCLSCHNAQNEDTSKYAHNRIWLPPTTVSSSHYGTHRTCTTCHDIHNSETGFLVANKDLLCGGPGGCHGSNQIDVTKFFETAYPAGAFGTTSQFAGMGYQSNDTTTITDPKAAARASHVFMKTSRYYKN